MKNFSPNLDWFQGSIIYIDFDHRTDKLNVFRKYKNEYFHDELTSEQFKPFVWFGDSDKRKYFNIKHGDSYRELKMLYNNNRDKNLLLSPETQFLIQSKQK